MSEKITQNLVWKRRAAGLLLASSALLAGCDARTATPPAQRSASVSPEVAQSILKAATESAEAMTDILNSQGHVDDVKLVNGIIHMPAADGEPAYDIAFGPVLNAGAGSELPADLEGAYIGKQVVTDGVVSIEPQLIPSESVSFSPVDQAGISRTVDMYVDSTNAAAPLIAFEAGGGPSLVYDGMPVHPGQITERN